MTTLVANCMQADKCAASSGSQYVYGCLRQILLRKYVREGSRVLNLCFRRLLSARVESACESLAAIHVGCMPISLLKQRHRRPACKITGGGIQAYGIFLYRYKIQQR
jgi:hypothetical protein